MKRSILLCIFLVALTVPAWADKVTPQQAAAVAERFLSAESPVTKSAMGSIRLAGTWPQVQTKGAVQEPALYLFECDGGGYVVVAADDVSLPVIGYSTTGQLSKGELPCNLRYMLDWHASMIDYARNHGSKATSAIKAQWQSTKGNEGEEVRLETAQWDQSGLPWNAMIPKLGDKDCHAGCVATAQAIILRYHQWPEKGTGTLPSYYWYSGGKEMPGHALGHEYDWSQMPLVYEPGQYTEEQGHQVAQLLYDLAIANEMDFHPSGSGAATESVFCLTKYFGIDKQMRLMDWDYYSKDVWEEMIRAEIDANRPIYYAGTTDYEGHAFVVDGYKGPYFSLNYGWSGYFNDYYLLRPTVELDPGKVTLFSSWQAMVTNLYPDRGGEVYPIFTDDTLIPFPWDFRSKSFPVGGREVDIYTSEDTEAWLGFVLFDREGRFKATTCEPFLVSSSNPYIPEVTCNITCSIEDGDCLKLAELIDDQWIPIQQSANAYLEFHPGQKITDLISLDFSLGDVDYPHLPKHPYLYLRGAKDIYWEIWSEDLGERLATSQSTFSDAEWEGKYYSMVARWTRESNEYCAVLQLQPGKYRIFLRNFDEEMTLYVKL